MEALCAMYGDQWQSEDELAGAYRVEVTEGRCEAALHIKLPPQYPCSAPPQYQLSAPTLTRTNKKISQATHNIYAYRVLHKGCMQEQCDDDGEKAAGGRLLHLLQEGRLKHLHKAVDWQSKSIYTRIIQTMATGATNVMVVVTRWRGGVNIGPDRYRHINSVARQAQQQLSFVKKSSDKILLIRQRSVCARRPGALRAWLYQRLATVSGQKHSEFSKRQGATRRHGFCYTYQRPIASMIQQLQEERFAKDQNLPETGTCKNVCAVRGSALLYFRNLRSLG
ncbi:hypothetical protein J6590_103391, partial [Homalodisca vitripennis]